MYMKEEVQDFQRATRMVQVVDSEISNCEAQCYERTKITWDTGDRFLGEHVLKDCIQYIMS